MAVLAAKDDISGIIYYFDPRSTVIKETLDNLIVGNLIFSYSMFDHLEIVNSEDLPELKDYFENVYYN